MGKFFNNTRKDSYSKYIKIGIIALAILVVLIILLLVILLNSQGNKNAKIIFKDSLVIELNSKLPDANDCVADYDGYKSKFVYVDASKVKLNTPGIYEVIVTTKRGDKKIVSVSVNDTTPPKLVTKILTINQGEKYDAASFKKSCSDNSGDQCIITFSTNEYDDFGNIINYSQYSVPGTYSVKLIASDTFGNKTKPIDAKLIIK